MENYIPAAEKRRYKRVDVSLPVEYRNLRNPTELPKGSSLRNISEGGVCFSSGKFMSLACRLVLTISLPDNPVPIKAISKVAWIRKTSSNDQYELGNQFLEITKADRAHIIDFVKSVLGASL